MGHGRAGAPGRSVLHGVRPGEEPVIIPHLKGAEQTVSAPPLRLDAVKVRFCSLKMLLSAK